MSVSGVNSIGPDVTTPVRLASLAGAAQAQAATSVAVGHGRPARRFRAGNRRAKRLERLYRGGSP